MVIALVSALTFHFAAVVTATSAANPGRKKKTTGRNPLGKKAVQQLVIPCWSSIGRGAGEPPSTTTAGAGWRTQRAGFVCGEKPLRQAREGRRDWVTGSRVHRRLYRSRWAPGRRRARRGRDPALHDPATTPAIIRIHIQWLSMTRKKIQFWFMQST